jgi:hypothetical protein
VQETITESSTSSLSKKKKKPYTMFPTDSCKSDILHWVIKTQNKHKYGGLPSNAKRQKIHYHPTIVSKKNAYPRNKRGLDLMKY